MGGEFLEGEFFWGVSFAGRSSSKNFDPRIRPQSSGDSNMCISGEEDYNKNKNRKKTKNKKKKEYRERERERNSGSRGAKSPLQKSPGPATTQNVVVKFDGEICGGVLLENASDDFPPTTETRKSPSKLRRKFATNFAANFANFTLEIAGA